MALKVALVGAGGMGDARHAPALRRYADENPGAIELAGVADMRADRVELFKEKFGFERGFETAEQMLDALDLDACFVIVQYYHIASVAEQVLRAGVHCFMEKPPGTTAEETQLLASLAEERGLTTQVGFNRRHMPATRAAEKWLAEKEVPIQAIRATKHRVNRINEPFAIYTSVHAVDLSCAFGGPVAEMHVVREALPYKLDVHNFWSTLHFVNGAVGHVSGLPDVGYHHEVYEFWTREGLLVVEHQAKPGNAPFRHYRGTELIHDEPATTTDPIEVDGFAQQTAHFLEAVRDGQPGYPEVRETIEPLLLTQLTQEGKSWRQQHRF